MKRPISTVFAVTALLLTALRSSEASPPVGKPNFIVINIDDMGYADIGPFGSKLNRTPHLDRLAAEGASSLASTPRRFVRPRDRR